MPRKRVYLAGPMRGHDRLNWPKFAEAAAELRALGYIVVSPAEIDQAFSIDPDDPATWQGSAEHVRRDVEALCECDMIALMPGWQQSVGASAERAVARWLGLEIRGVWELTGKNV